MTDRSTGTGQEVELLKHNYGKKVLDLWRMGKCPAGDLTHVDIFHDGWCAIYHGGYCNCAPIVQVRAP